MPRLPSLPKLYLRRVVGSSMLPTLRPGTVVIAYQKRAGYERGEIVIVQHDGLEKIKRIRDARPDAVFVLGDNPAESTDSRQFGWLPAQAVLAKVITFKRASRVRLPK